MPTVSPNLDQAARLFHALSDPTRLELVERLQHGERCVCELTDVMGAAQSRLSFHLRTLKEAGLITDRREGRWVYYSLNHPVLDDLAGALEGLASRKGSAFRALKCCG